MEYTFVNPDVIVIVVVVIVVVVIVVVVVVPDMTILLTDKAAHTDDPSVPFLQTGFPHTRTLDRSTPNSATTTIFYTTNTTPHHTQMIQTDQKGTT